jgi:GNAT superfamily N-acetyltransferase
VENLRFVLAQREHARAIDQMRIGSNVDLAARIGLGSGSTVSRIASIRERIDCGDPVVLRKLTLYCALVGDQVVGSVAVSTFPPGFWKRQFWREPKAMGLGVFGLVVFPHLQGHGYGRFLMTGVESLARSHGIRYVRLDAYSANPLSNGFYRAIGYEERAMIDLRGTGLVLYEKAV